MKDTSASVDEHHGSAESWSGSGGLEQAGRDIDGLTVDDLASVDQFHTRGPSRRFPSAQREVEPRRDGLAQEPAHGCDLSLMLVDVHECP